MKIDENSIENKFDLELLQTIKCRGHINILGSHRTTLEVSKDSYLTPKGDCIIGINSDHACSDLNENTKIHLKSAKKFYVKLICNQYEDHFTGWGHPGLTLKDEKDIVFRKSNFICDRTIMINCSKSARDIDRNLIQTMINHNSKMELEIYLVKEEEGIEI